MNVSDALALVANLKARVHEAQSRAYWLNDSEGRLVYQFHALADGWLALARAVELDPGATYDGGNSKAEVLEEMAPRLIMHAQNIEHVFSDAGFAASMRHFLTEFPLALRDTASGAFEGAADIIGDTALSLAGPAFIIGLGAVALVFLFSKSGGQLRLPFVKVGG